MDTKGDLKLKMMMKKLKMLLKLKREVFFYSFQNLIFFMDFCMNVVEYEGKHMAMVRWGKTYL